MPSPETLLRRFVLGHVALVAYIAAPTLLVFAFLAIAIASDVVPRFQPQARPPAA